MKERIKQFITLTLNISRLIILAWGDCRMAPTMSIGQISEDGVTRKPFIDIEVLGLPYNRTGGSSFQQWYRPCLVGTLGTVNRDGGVGDCCRWS